MNADPATELTSVQAPTRPLRVLVVDDDIPSARVLGQLLREDGFEVEILLDGPGAIARLRHGPVPDALVTDDNVPHADGLAIASYARSLRSGMPVFVVSSHPELVSRRTASMAPPVVVLTKPLAYAELALRLSEHALAR